MDASALQPESGRRPRRPWLAVLVSLWLPGMGQWYAGARRRAVAVFLGGPLLVWGLALAGLPRRFEGFLVWIGLGLGWYLLVAWDAARQARAARGDASRPDSRWYHYLLIAAVGVVAAQGFVRVLPVRTFFIPTSTMEPTLRIGDRLLADMTWWRRHAPERGELVVFVAPERPDRLLLKRVVGLPGETIEIRDKTVWVDGRPLDGDWGVHRDPGTYPAGSGTQARRDNFGPLRIPAASLFVLGDNRDFSYDSRFWGPVPEELLRARPLFVYWAPDRSRVGLRLR